MGVAGSSPENSHKKKAMAGIEPANKAFAELGLTTWLHRPIITKHP